MIFHEIKEIHVSVGDILILYPSTTNVEIRCISTFDKSIRIHGDPITHYDRTGVRLSALITAGSYCNIPNTSSFEQNYVLKNVKWLMSGIKGPYRLITLKKE